MKESVALVGNTMFPFQQSSKFSWEPSLPSFFHGKWNEVREWQTYLAGFLYSVRYDLNAELRKLCTWEIDLSNLQQSSRWWRWAWRKEDISNQVKSRRLKGTEGGAEGRVSRKRNLSFHTHTYLHASNTCKDLPCPWKAYSEFPGQFSIDLPSPPYFWFFLCRGLAFSSLVLSHSCSLSRNVNQKLDFKSNTHAFP